MPKGFKWSLARLECLSPERKFLMSGQDEYERRYRTAEQAYSAFVNASYNIKALSRPYRACISKDGKTVKIFKVPAEHEKRLCELNQKVEALLDLVALAREKEKAGISCSSIEKIFRE